MQLWLAAAVFGYVCQFGIAHLQSHADTLQPGVRSTLALPACLLTAFWLPSACPTVFLLPGCFSSPSHQIDLQRHCLYHMREDTVEQSFLTQRSSGPPHRAGEPDLPWGGWEACWWGRTPARAPCTPPGRTPAGGRSGRPAGRGFPCSSTWSRSWIVKELLH